MAMVSEVGQALRIVEARTSGLTPLRPEWAFFTGGTALSARRGKGSSHRSPAGTPLAATDEYMVA